MPKLSGLFLSCAGAVIGSILLIIGLAMAFGIAAGFISLGLLIFAGSLLLIDTDGTKESRK